MKWFKREVPEAEKKNPHLLDPNSVDVEMSAYVLLTYLQKGLVEDGLHIMRWLVTQQNDEGGYASTQVHQQLSWTVNFCLKGTEIQPLDFFFS